MATQVRYFDSQVFEPARELTREEAERRGHFVRAVFVDGRPERCDVVGPEGVKRVHYYDRDWPDEALAAWHRERYPGLGAVVHSRVRRRPDGLGEKTRIDLDHRLERLGWREEVLLGNGDILIEKILRPDGTIVVHHRYGYTADGRLERVLEVLPDGREVIEYEPDI
jgi:hypothetical protein